MVFIKLSQRCDYLRRIPIPIKFIQTCLNVLNFDNLSFHLQAFLKKTMKCFFQLITHLNFVVLCDRLSTFPVCLSSLSVET